MTPIALCGVAALLAVAGHATAAAPHRAGLYALSAIVLTVALARWAARRAGL